MAKSVDDIDKKIAELQAEKMRLVEAEREKKSREHWEEANVIIARLVDDLRRLGEIGYVPPKLGAALTTSKGKYNPGQYVKRFKAPLKHAVSYSMEEDIED